MKAILLAAVLAIAAPASAQQNCAANPPVPGFAAGQANMSDHLVIGQAVSLSLKPQEEAGLTPIGDRPAKPGSFAGSFPMEIKIAGTYRIVLSDRVWIDVVQGGAAMVSTDHQHGAPCSGIAKIVAFKLEPGRYAVQLSEATSRAMVAKVMREGVLPAKLPPKLPK